MPKAVCLHPEILQAFEALPDPYLLLSPDFTILTASKPYLQVAMRQLADIQGKNLFEVFPDNPDLPEPGSTARLRQSLEWVLEHMQAQRIALTRNDAKESITSTAFTGKNRNALATPVLTASGEVHYLILRVEDATAQETNGTREGKGAAQVAARQEVKEQELEQRVADRIRELQQAKAETEAQRNRLQQLLMEAPAPICILSGESLVYELVNPSYARLFPGRQLLGKPIVEALPEIRNNKVYRTFRETFDTGITHEEMELLIPFISPEDGIQEDRYFRYIQQARFNEQGQVDGVVVFALEVTAQVEARKAVEQSVERLQLITDALPVLIGYLDHEEKYRFANKAYEAWFSMKPEALLGRPVREVIGDKAYAGVKHYINRALAGERLDFESKMPYREDFVKYIKTSYVPDVRNGKVAGFYTLVSDVTEQTLARLQVEQRGKEARTLSEKLEATNEELILTNAQLVRTNVDLDNFIYTASHDLKAPIYNIERLIEIVLEFLPAEVMATAEVKQVKSMIEGSVQRFKRTIEHLTEVIKLQKENNPKTEEVDLAEVISDVRLDLLPQLEATGTRLSVAVGNCTTVQFSQKNLRSIIYNLLSNAIKYNSPDRRSEVHISCDRKEDYAVLTVRDNGLGMNRLGREKLFTMFGRLHDHVEGAGIGLYMVKKIVENAGGHIEVETKAGTGSTFRVYLRG
ncbi:PAS domain-containing sensor histidine kinase [Pontibacter flavimaris]|uniref:histidine kinase n=1 Tax=Pontibacter flavimaris TaxID=1797110 RepID=A0A1Q5P8Y5_9BACT|nr:PAS domain-containing protein [Pontibacter flavimaris]OKL38700.1 hypothetical protein A3841_06050 [Pontibacter flavimaris]